MEIRQELPVKLITGIMYQNARGCEQAVKALMEQYGDIEKCTPELDFSFTNYYEEEMGTGLRKIFCSFVEPIDPNQLIDIKIYTNTLEERWLQNGKRTVNIDPGYIHPAKLVLATTKDFAHRVLLGRGIYGDVHLTWHGQGFQATPWTYPDYQLPVPMQFFIDVRNNFLQQLPKS
jgi:hypothetical protein